MLFSCQNCFVLVSSSLPSALPRLIRSRIVCSGIASTSGRASKSREHESLIRDHLVLHNLIQSHLIVLVWHLNLVGRPLKFIFCTFNLIYSQFMMLPFRHIATLMGCSCQWQGIDTGWRNRPHKTTHPTNQDSHCYDHTPKHM